MVDWLVAGFRVIGDCFGARNDGSGLAFIDAEEVGRLFLVELVAEGDVFFAVDEFDVDVGFAGEGFGFGEHGNFSWFCNTIYV